MAFLVPDRSALTRAFFITSVCAVVLSAEAQCGREYPSGFWHSDTVLTAAGDTINLSDEAGYYQGWHVYSNDRDCRMLDTVAYIYGRFEHGKPIGDWLEHCADGSYSSGPFTRGEEMIIHPDGREERKKQGIYSRVGVWRSYDRDSDLVRTVRYSRTEPRKDAAVWTHQQHVLDAKGRWGMTEYIRNGRGVYASPKHKRMERSWQDDGTPIEFSRKRKHRSSRVLFYISGRKKWKNRCGWSLLYFHHRCVTRTWTEDGRLIEKRVTVRPQPPIYAPHNEETDDVF